MNSGHIYLLPMLLALFCIDLSTGCISSHAAAGYQGREQGAEWRNRAAERIEKIRKAEMVVEVVDGKGQPLPGAQVTVAMQRHRFGFGTAVTALDLTAQTPEGEHYRQTVAKNFNRAVFENDLKWGPWETSKEYPNSVYRMENIDKALGWLNSRGIAVRGHYVVYGHLEGDGGTARRKILPAEDFRAAVMSHAEEKVRLVGTRVTEWDVVNHPIGWGKGTMPDRFGAGFYDFVFDQVAKWNPQARRYINEGGVLPSKGANREKYFSLISEMRARGAKIEGIGFMGHFKGDRDLTPPEELLATFDRYAKFGLPLQVTEFDVRFANEANHPFALTSEQEALQADYLRDFLIAAFSHPSFEGVVIWGFWEARHWYPDAALYRKDWSIKPNGKVWEELVLRQWWTNESRVTDHRGRFATRGFLGEYVVKVNYRGKNEVVKQVTLGPSGTALRVTLK